MTAFNFQERAKVLRLASGRAGRVALAGALGSRLLRWRYGAALGEHVVLVPQELRGADVTFADELAMGELGLAGYLAHPGKASPFKIVPPSAAWARELHGFGWLRHLRVAKTHASEAAARALIDQWISGSKDKRGTAWQADVTGRRMLSWLANADMLLHEVDPPTFDRTLQCLADQLIYLSSAWRTAPDGYPRLLALTGLVMGDLCIAGHTRHLAKSERLLGAELEHQILPDGGHVSRNATLLVEILLDLLPLKQSFVTAKRRLPASIETAIARILPMLRYMRLGDGSLARFNGVGRPQIAELSTILAYDVALPQALADAPQSRYIRLEQGTGEQGRLVLIADTGPPPPLAFGGESQAGCLSIEVSAGACAIFVNGGMPEPADDKHRAAARATASHNTLSLGDRASARRVVYGGLARQSGGDPLALAGTVLATKVHGPLGAELDASHSGYVPEFGLVHQRHLVLAANGDGLDGIDRLGGPGRSVRLARDVPFAIHFHLAPRVGCESRADGSLELRLRDGSRWLFAASAASVSIEPSMHFADPSGPVAAQQIVLRGASWGETEVRWSLHRWNT